MKILQINSVHYRRGGADVVYLNTGKLLEEHGHEVFYFSQKNENNYPANTSDYFIEPINYFKVSTLKRIASLPRFFYSTESARKIDNLITKFNPEIAHVHLYKADLTPSILKVLKRFHIPVAITLHDYGLLCPHNSMLNGRGEICEKCLETNNALYCIKNKCNRGNYMLSTISSFEYIFHDIVAPYDKYFDRLITVSKFSYNLHYREKSFRNKISHLYNFYPRLIDKLPNSRKGNYFLFYGRISEEKGILTLLKAFKKANVKHLLKIVGNGPILETVINFIVSNNLEEKVELLGFKSGNELNKIISNASFIIVPSEWYENNPLTIIEAYANGKPVIGSKIGGIPEIIQDRKTGFLFKMKNIEELQKTLILASEQSEKDYFQLSMNCRKFAEEHFNQEKHYTDLIKIYLDTIKNK